MPEAEESCEVVEGGGDSDGGDSLRDGLRGGAVAVDGSRPSRSGREQIRAPWRARMQRGGAWLRDAIMTCGGGGARVSRRSWRPLRAVR